MKTSFLQAAALAGGLSLALASCAKSDLAANQLKGCDQDLVCTTDLRSISIRVRDSAGNPVALSAYKTIRLRGNISFVQQEDSATERERRNRGEYPIVSDNFIRQIKKEGEAFTFYGYRGSQEVIRRNYTIGQDCCHIVQKDSNSAVVIVTLPQ